MIAYNFIGAFLVHDPSVRFGVVSSVETPWTVET